MFVDVCSPSTIDVDGGCARFIPAHSAWSRELYQSAATTFTASAGSAKSTVAAGSGWPERHYIHQIPFGHRQGPTKATSEHGNCHRPSKLLSWLARRPPAKPPARAHSLARPLVARSPVARSIGHRRSLLERARQTATRVRATTWVCHRCKSPRSACAPLVHSVIQAIDSNDGCK